MDPSTSPLADPHIVAGTRAARGTRNRLGAPPDGPLNVDLVRQAEQALGVAVCILPLPPGIAGAYLRKRGRPFIFLQSTDYPTRQRFTLAHELGHHVLGHRGRVDNRSEIGADSVDLEERQANHFAGELLAPAAAVAQRLRVDGGPSELTLERLVELAGEFHISPPAMLYRIGKCETAVGEARLGELWDAIRAQEHVAIAERLGIKHGSDEISRHYDASNEDHRRTRFPARLAEKVRIARDAGLIGELFSRRVLAAA